MKRQTEINQLIEAISAHAEPRDYDLWVFGISILGILASLSVAYFAYRLNKKQIEIAKKQSEISAEQTQIAQKQTEIMEQQNKIALFEKRHELYIFFRDFNTMIGILSPEIFIKNLHNPYTKYDNFMSSIDLLLNLKKNNN